MKKTITTLFALLVLLSVGGCQKKEIEPEPPVIKKTLEFYPESVEDAYGDFIPALNTPVVVKVYETEDIETLVNGLTEIYEDGHKLLDSHHYYRDENGDLLHNVCYINDYYGNDEGVEVSDELICVLEEAIGLMKLTRGYFDPFIGEMSMLYDGLFSSFPIENSDPDHDLLKKAADERIAMEDIEKVLEIRKEEHRLIFHKYKDIEKISIDLGAFSKGYVSDKVKEYLKDYDALISEGNSSIATTGNKTGRIGIENPNNRYELSYIIELKQRSISSSGDNNRYYIYKDEEGNETIRCHILNPFTGISENHYRLVSVLCDHGALADALSTALFSIDDMDMIKEILDEAERLYQDKISISLIREEDDKLIIMSDLGIENILEPGSQIERIEVIER